MQECMACPWVSLVVKGSADEALGAARQWGLDHAVVIEERSGGVTILGTLGTSDDYLMKLVSWETDGWTYSQRLPKVYPVGTLMLWSDHDAAVSPWPRD